MGFYILGFSHFPFDSTVMIFRCNNTLQVVVISHKCKGRRVTEDKTNYRFMCIGIIYVVAARRDCMGFPPVLFHSRLVSYMLYHINLPSVRYNNILKISRLSEVPLTANLTSTRRRRQ